MAGIFDMLGDVEKMGKQFTEFLNAAQAQLQGVLSEVQQARSTLNELHAKIDRIEGAHHTIFEWLAEIDGEHQEELAETATAAAETAAEAAEVATEAAAVVAEAEAATVEETIAEEIEMPPEEKPAETPAAAEHKPAEGEGAKLPETPVPAAEENKPEEKPTESRSSRRW